MNAAAPWLLPTNGRITVTVKPGIGAYTRFRTLPAVPWLHVRNQEKRFAREHFTFARQQKRFPRCRRTGVVFRRSRAIIRGLQLMARVFALNVLECPRCRSRMRILAAIEDPVVARKILDSLGLPSRAPPVAPARHNRQDELAQF